MKLTIVQQEQVAAHSAARWGDFGQDESLADLIRAEVTARGSCPRWTALRRLEQLLGDEHADQNRARLRELCDGLQYEGDLTASSGGVLNASPVRAIELEAGVHRMVCSLPSRRLRASLPGELHVDGLRRLHRFDPDTESEVAAALQALGGMVVSPQAWAGLDLTPVADSAWLDNLDQRLEWRPEAAASLERDGALDWQGLVLTADGPRWRRNSDQSTRLWRARTSYGRWIWAWASEGDTPAVVPFVRLQMDDAMRAAFAVANVAGKPARGMVDEHGVCIALTIGLVLPRAEHRFLSMVAAWSGIVNAQYTYRFPKGLWEQVRVLEDRLGIEWMGAFVARAESAGSAQAELVAKPLLDTGATTVPPLQEPDPLDDALPMLPAMGPLLSRLEVATYRDLLQLDMDRVRSMPGVGRRKLTRLRALREEAVTREEAPSSAVPAEVNEESALPGPYEDWAPLEVFGSLLGTRSRGVIESEQLTSIAALRAWVQRVNVRNVENYGRKTHGKLLKLLERLDNEGWEGLVFGGPAPQGIATLASRYLEILPPRERRFFHARFVQQHTLEQIGTKEELTRERVRQVIERQMARDRPVWGKLALELLDPALAHLEERGGVCATSAVCNLLGQPEAWQLTLTLELASESLVVDVVDGVSTTLPLQKFDELRRNLRSEAEALCSGGASPAEALALLDEFDLSFPSETEGTGLLVALARLDLVDGRLYPGRRSMSNVVLAILHAAGGPLSARAIAEQVSAQEDQPAIEARGVAALAVRSREVVHASHGQWIHRDHLAVDKETLEGVLEVCAAEVRAAGGKAVSIRKILQRLKAAGKAPEDLHPYTLRDLLLSRGEYRGWRSGTDVAWLGGDVRRKPIVEHIKAVASELEQPFGLDALAITVAERSGCTVNSVYTQVQQCTDLLRIDFGQYVSTSQTLPDTVDLGEIGEVIHDSLPAEGVVSSRRLDERVSRIAATVSGSGVGHRLVWGLAMTHPMIAGVTSGHLLWRREGGDELWTVLGPVIAREMPLLRASTLCEWLIEHAGWSGTVGESSRLLQRGLSGGQVRRVGAGWFILDSADWDFLVQSALREPDVVRLAQGSQDFVRESPSRELLNELRIRRGLFRILPG